MNQELRYEYYRIRVEKILKLFLSIQSPGKVLDIGCRKCRLLEKLRTINPSLDLYGCDIEYNNPDFNIKRCDVEKGLPYGDDFFDVIFICDVIEHLKEDNFVLNEISRCLKEGGHLILTTPNVTSLWKRIQFLFGYVPSDLRLPHHIRFNNFKTIEKKLNKTGLTIDMRVTSNIPYPIKRFNLFKPLAIKLGDYFYSVGNHIIIRAKK